MPEETPSDRLKRALARLLLARRAADDAALASLPPEAFRAIVAERLRALERDLAEVRTRVNGLLFVVAGAAVTQIVLRVLG
mgnify:CR=1 FL=1